MDTPVGDSPLFQLFGHGLPLIAPCERNLSHRMTIFERWKNAHRTKPRVALEDFGESCAKRLLRLCHSLTLGFRRGEVRTARDGFGLGNRLCELGAVFVLIRPGPQPWTGN